MLHAIPQSENLMFPGTNLSAPTFPCWNIKLQEINWEALREVHIDDSYEFFKNSVSSAVLSMTASPGLNQGRRKRICTLMER